MRFVNRKGELHTLQRLYDSNSFEFVPVYGRRRIGKTRLIEEFIKDKDSIYFLADAVAEKEQLKNMGKTVGEFFSDQILQDNGFKDWYQFFSYLKNKANKSNKKIILVIDEFPYLVNSNPAISSIFQKGIDEYLKNTFILLILMGSSIGMMEKEILFYKAPLYGRRTASIEINEMRFSTLTEFFPKKTFNDIIKIYSVFGVIPAYLEKVNPASDIFENIRYHILDKNSFMYNEVEFLLREELREPRNYFAILKAIAQGKQKVSEIINETGFEKSMVSKYLDILRSLKFIVKDIPVTEKNPEKSKMGIYRLFDMYFTFWFKFIFQNKRFIEIERPELVLKIIKENLEQHVSGIFEEVCRDICFDLMKNNLIQYTQIGKWWSKNAEIDIAALDEEDKTVWFGECKWSNKKVGENIYSELVEKSKLVDYFGKSQKNRYILFSKNGFTENMKKIALKENVLLIGREYYFD